MAYEYDVWHAVAQGRSYQGAEGWSMGFWLGKVNAHSGPPSVTDANLIHERIKAFFGHADAQISWAFVLDSLKLQYWSADGTLNKNETVFSEGIAAQAGAEQRNQVPQVALAVSFRGAVARGPGANGRMYIPGFVNIPTVSGHIEQSEVNALSAVAEDCFSGINADLVSTGNKLILASKGGVTPPAPPVNVEVTHLRIGDVVDTIDRRRNGLRENYTLTALAV